MSSDAVNGYHPDGRASWIYEAAVRHEDEVLESVCPSFVDLGNDAGRYSEPERIGRGGLKEVFRVYDRKMERWVAMARLRSDRGLQFYELFVREARLVGTLNHPNIIKAYDIGVDENGAPFFTMSLKGKTTLADLLQDEKTARSSLMEIFLKTCDAIAYAHSRGIAHFDLKPENIQCDRFGKVVVCDWGLGCRLDQPEASGLEETSPMRQVETMTLTGQVKGTLGYMAPEQVLPARKKDERTDVYALGCILHSMLCGHPPFTGTKDEVLEKTTHSDVRSLRKDYPEKSVSRSLDAVVLKATCHDPDTRYQSVAELRHEIQNYLNGYATEAEQPPFIKEAAMFVARNRVSSGIFFAAMLVVTVLSVLFVQRLGRQHESTQEEYQRAQRLLKEVSTVSSEYEAFSTETILSKKHLAEQLTQRANEIRMDGRIRNPVRSACQAKHLLKIALQIDPECASADRHLFRMNCQMLNFETALKEHRNPMRLPSHRALALAFPQYNFDDGNRPSSEQVISVIRKAGQLGVDKMAGYLEYVFCFHSAAINGRRSVVPELAELLSLYNGGSEYFTIQYDEESCSAHIVSDRSVLSFRAGNRRSGYNLLDCIPLRSLSVSVPGTLSLSCFDKLDLESLDVSSCGNILLDKWIKLPRLKQLYIPRDRIGADVLRRKIKSYQPFEIVEQ